MPFHFFTSVESITNLQSPELAYGPLEIEQNIERFNLENKLTVAPNSPAFAVSKSLVLVLDSADTSAGEELLNIALFPIETNFLAGFPIKFFIYRGITKSALLDNTGIVKQPDNSWSQSNILQIIQDIQTKINEQNETRGPIIPDFNALGLQFDTLDPSKTLESVLLDNTDEFQPLIVPAGCQIGKFKGGAILAGIEVVLDKVGYEANISILKSKDHILEIEGVDSTSATLKKDLFINRMNKEEILAYMDITAFYGACVNQSLEILGVPNDPSFLSTFHHKETVYLDIRDKRGYSFNHFFELSDFIQIGFQNASSGEIEYQGLNYYSDWPILRLSGRTFSQNEKFFFIKIPIALGMPVHANILTSYTRKVSFGPSQRDRRYMFLNQQDEDGTIISGESDPIRFANWQYSNNQLGANQFLLKLDRIVPTFDKASILSPIWDSFFSLDMENVFSDTTIQDGEFRVKTYHSINAPLLVAAGGEEVYYPIMGIAADRHQITFFTIYLEPAAKLFKIPDEVYHSQIINTGKYKFKVDEERLNYTDMEQAVGFLYQFVNNERISDYELAKEHFTITSESGIAETIEFMHYKKIGETNEFDDFIDNFQAISLTYEEYEHLKNLMQSPTGLSEEYIGEHPFYLSSNENRTYDLNKFMLVETLLTLGVARITDQGDTNFTVEMSPYPTAIELAGEPIILRSVNYN